MRYNQNAVSNSAFFLLLLFALLTSMLAVSSSHAAEFPTLPHQADAGSKSMVYYGVAAQALPDNSMANRWTRFVPLFREAKTLGLVGIPSGNDLACPAWRLMTVLDCLNRTGMYGRLKGDLISLQLGGHSPPDTRCFAAL